ncbi:MAG: DUF1428 domain-containing protein [Pseudomonadota bacterium]
MSYYGGFVAAVPDANKESYVAHAREAWDKIFKPLGAIAMVECWGDHVPDGKVTSFPMAVKAKEGESVIFSWIEWPDKATHDAANEKMMSPDFDGGMDMAEMPFDGQRLIWGGFAPVLSLRT